MVPVPFLTIASLAVLGCVSSDYSADDTTEVRWCGKKLSLPVNNMCQKGGQLDCAGFDGKGNPLPGSTIPDQEEPADPVLACCTNMCTIGWIYRRCCHLAINRQNPQRFAKSRAAHRSLLGGEVDTNNLNELLAKLEGAIEEHKNETE